MALEGKSKIEIAEELNKCGILTPSVYKKDKKIINSKQSENLIEVWNSKKIDRILQNQAYTGDLIQSKRKRISHKIHKLISISQDDWVVIPNHHTPIISKETFEHVNNILYGRDNRVKNDKKYDIFSGYLKCADCNNTFTIKKGSTNEYYYCSSYVRQKTCSKHTISKKKLEESVLHIINNQINLLSDMDTIIDKTILKIK